MSRTATIALILISALSLSACSAQVPVTTSDPTLDSVQGLVTVPRFVSASFGLNTGVGQSCSAKAGYDDIAEGSQVTIKDDSGKTVAFAPLGKGEVSSKDPFNAGNYIYCEFAFTIDKLPSASIYAVSIGGAQRGVVNFDLTEVKAKGFAISIG